jgi:predicted secreted protein
MMRFSRYFLLGALLLGASAWAETPLRYNQVHLQAQQSESVSNDTMHVTLAASGEQRIAAKLAAQINQDMEWALSVAGDYAKVKAGTGSYQTWQISHENVIKGWRGQQEITLESKDVVGLSRLTGQLQEKLQVKSMRFTVSDEMRSAVENRLINAALEAFKERAAIVVENLQASGYRIVDLNIGTTAQRPPVAYQSRMVLSAMDEAAPVAVEGGESDIRVTASGSIELTIP